MDPATLLSRTVAGDAELTSARSGLSLGQRKLLTHLDQPQALEEFAAAHVAHGDKLERDLERLAALNLIVLNGRDSRPAATSVVLGGGWTASALRFLIPLLLLAGGALIYFGMSRPAMTPPQMSPSHVSAGETTPVRPPAATPSRDIAARVHAQVAPVLTQPVGNPVSMPSPAPVPVPVPVPVPAPSRNSRTPHGTRGSAGDPDPAAPLNKARIDSPARAANAVPLHLLSTATGDTGAGRRHLDHAPSAPSVAPAPPVSERLSARSGDLPTANLPTAVTATPAAPTARDLPKPVAATDATEAPKRSTIGIATAAAAAKPAVAPKLAMAAPDRAAAKPHHPPKLSPLVREDPEYPREALARGVTSGKVMARVSIDAHGKVETVTIIESRPGRVFDHSVKRALAHWVFPAGDAGRSAEVEIAFKRD